MRAAIGLTALHDYALSLRPEGAPQFDLDATTRRVSLYPGNVVRLRFEAQRVVSLFGQVVDRAGKPMASARVSAGSDFAVADDHGFFTITAPLNATVDIKGAAGESCTDHQVGSLVKAGDPVLLYRIGKLTCR
jgi:outer membrane usher protein FimD/PapC